jgi:NAD(P) transhydrogenase subunit alpha
MTRTTVAAVRETAPGERRVAVTPESAARLREAGFAVLVEHGAGAGAWFADEDYARAGAEVVTADEAYTRADVLLCVGRPAPGRLRAGQTVVGMLEALTDPAFAADLAGRGVTAVTLEGLPRTLSRAQAMDALSSQANVAGYKAVLVAADAYDRYFPMLVTAAGTARPARVLVLGAGVAGLQAIGTARRLGAVVTGYDVRPQTRTEVESVGGRFLALSSVADAAGDGGYARALTAEERDAQQHELAGHVADHDVVIATARVPGRRPPLLVTEDAVKAMAAGSVVVDLAAGPLGGNVAGSVPGATVVTDNGVTVIGAGDLAARMPAAASAAYARNLCALLAHLAPDGVLVIDPADEIQAGVVVTHAGRVVHPALTGSVACSPCSPSSC